MGTIQKLVDVRNVFMDALNVRRGLIVLAAKDLCDYSRELVGLRVLMGKNYIIISM